MKTIGRRVGLSPFDLSLTSIIVAGNFAISLYVAPVLMLFIPKVFVGALLMTPLNLFLAYFVWATTGKRIFSLYFLTFGLLTMPTTLWGNTPGFYKPLLGIAIGLSLDVMAIRLRPSDKAARFLMAILFPLIWWALTGGMWTLAGLPIVQLFQAMLMGVPVLRPIVTQGFAATFATIAFMTMPSSVVATKAAVSLSKRLGQIIMMPQVNAIRQEVKP